MKSDSFKKQDLKCPICGKMVTKANYMRHYNACSNPNSKLNLKKASNISHLDHDGLFCKFCGKECKNKNSLIQHEIRCKENPDRKDYQFNEKYKSYSRKGHTKYNDPIIAKQCATMKSKYENGYINPMKGKHNIHDYIWEDHNNQEILKWLNYINIIKNCLNIPPYEIYTHENTYNTIKGAWNKKKNTVEIEFEHHLLMYYMLNGNWSKENTVHHINLDIHDNSLTNLLAFRSNKEHKRFHNSRFAYLIYNEETHLFECEIKHK